MAQMKLKTASIRPQRDLNGNKVNDVDLGLSNMCTRHFRGTASESDQRMACPGRGGGEAAWGTGLGEPRKLSFTKGNTKTTKGLPGRGPNGRPGTARTTGLGWPSARPAEPLLQRRLRPRVHSHWFLKIQECPETS